MLYSLYNSKGQLSVRLGYRTSKFCGLLFLPWLFHSVPAAFVAGSLPAVMMWLFWDEVVGRWKLYLICCVILLDAVCKGSPVYGVSGVGFCSLPQGISRINSYRGLNS